MRLTSRNKQEQVVGARILEKFRQAQTFDL